MPVLGIVILSAVALAVVLALVWAVIERRPEREKDFDSASQRLARSMDRRDDYPEAMATYRHYSNLRFVMLTLFTTITGFMLGALLADAKPDTSGKILASLPTVGAWLTIVFFSLELILDTVQSNIALFISRANPNSHMRREGVMGWIQASVRIPIFIFFFVVFWLWLEISGTSDLCQFLWNP